MHHEREIEALVVDRTTSVAHVNVGCLRQRRQQLVGRLGRKKRWTGTRRRIRTAMHREAPGVEGIEARIAILGFVEMQPVHGFSEQRYDTLHVVAKAIVGGVRDHRVDWLAIDVLRDEGIGCNAFVDGRRAESL